MKKLLAMVLIVFILFTVVACGGNGETEDTTDSGQETTDETIENEEESNESEENDILRHLTLGETFIHRNGDRRQLEVTFHDDLTLHEIDEDIAQFFRFRNADGEMEDPSHLARISVTIEHQGELGDRLGLVGILGPDSLRWNAFSINDVGIRQPSNDSRIREHFDPDFDSTGFLTRELSSGEIAETALWFPISSGGSYRVGFSGGSRSSTDLPNGSVISGDGTRVIYFVISMD